MQQVQLDDEVFKAAQHRAMMAGYKSVDAYIADIVVGDVEEQETPNLDSVFTPNVIADLDKISAEVRAGGKTYSSSEVDDYLKQTREQWRIGK